VLHQISLFDTILMTLTESVGG